MCVVRTRFSGWCACVCDERVLRGGWARVPSAVHAMCMCRALMYVGTGASRKGVGDGWPMPRERETRAGRHHVHTMWGMCWLYASAFAATSSSGARTCGAAPSRCRAARRGLSPVSCHLSSGRSACDVGFGKQRASRCGANRVRRLILSGHIPCEWAPLHTSRPLSALGSRV